MDDKQSGQDELRQATERMEGVSRAEALIYERGGFVPPIAGTPATMLGEAVGLLERVRLLVSESRRLTGYGHHAESAVLRALGEVRYEHKQRAEDE
jgi:hypothetical protein